MARFTVRPLKNKKILTTSDVKYHILFVQVSANLACRPLKNAHQIGDFNKEVD